MQNILDILLIVLEVLLFLGLGLLYYFYQRRKIIKSSKEDLFLRVCDWVQENKIDLSEEDILSLFEENDFLAISNKVQSFKNENLPIELIRDLEEMSKYA